MPVYVDHSWLLPDAPAPVRQHKEDDLQAQVMEYLDTALPANAVAHHSPGEGKRTRAAQGKLKRSGYKRGWPDIEVIYAGRSYFVELKAAHGVNRQAQRDMQRKLRYCGCPVMLCRTLADTEAQLRAWGVPLRATVAA